MNLRSNWDSDDETPELQSRHHYNSDNSSLAILDYDIEVEDNLLASSATSLATLSHKNLTPPAEIQGTTGQVRVHSTVVRSGAQDWFTMDDA